MSNLNNHQSSYQGFKYIISPLENSKYLVVITPPPPVDDSSALPVETFESIEKCNEAVKQYIDYLIDKSIPVTYNEFKKPK